MIIKTLKKDLWDLDNQGILGIPVNLGLVCGRGLAAQWKEKFPSEYRDAKAYADDFRYAYQRDREFTLSTVVRDNTILISEGITLINNHILLPVKYYWNQPASKNLIENSLNFLHKFLKKNEIDHVPIFLPMLGCGFGDLTWEEVEPIMQRTSLEFFLVVPDTEIISQRYLQTLKPSVFSDKNFS